MSLRVTEWTRPIYKVEDYIKYMKQWNQPVLKVIEGFVDRYCNFYVYICMYPIEPCARSLGDKYAFRLY